MRSPKTQLELPFTCTYDVRRIRREAWTVALMVGVLVVFWLWLLVSKLPRIIHDAPDVGWGVTLAMIGVWLAMLAMYVLIAVPQTLARREALRREGECITVTESGIRFENGQRSVTLCWDEITGLVIEPPTVRIAHGYRYVVSSPDASFDFVTLIDNGPALRETLVRLAVNAGGWRQQGDSLLPDAAPGSAGKVYHYRTRSCRGGLLMWAAIGSIPFLSWGMDRLGWTDRPAQAGALVAGMVLEAPVLLLWRSYRSSRVLTDSLGITWQRGAQRRFISWSDVQEFHLAGGKSWGVVKGSRETVRFAMVVSDPSALVAEIERRTGKPACSKPAARA